MISVIERSNILKRLIVKVEWAGIKKEHQARDFADAVSWMKMYPVDAKIAVVSKLSNKVIFGR